MSVEVNNESGVEVDEREIVALARHVLARMRVHRQAELSVVLVDEAAMEQLHVQWMDEPGPTDVLSFPMDELRPGTDGEEESAPGLLGDVVLCPQVAGRQARQAGHTTQDELLLLTTHGILHLLGYDHAEPDEEREMFGLQRKLLLTFLATRGGGAAQAASRVASRSSSAPPPAPPRSSSGPPSPPPGPSSGPGTGKGRG